MAEHMHIVTRTISNTVDENSANGEEGNGGARKKCDKVTESSISTVCNFTLKDVPCPMNFLFQSSNQQQQRSVHFDGSASPSHGDPNAGGNSFEMFRPSTHTMAVDPSDDIGTLTTQLDARRISRMHTYLMTQD